MLIFVCFLFQFSPGKEYACANPYAFCMSDFVYGFLFVCFIAKIAEFVEIEIELRAQISFNNQMKGGESAITTINQQNGQNQWGTTLAPSN